MKVQKETLKSATYVIEVRDLGFLKAYLAGLLFTVATQEFRSSR